MLKSIIDTQLSPQRANGAGIVHDVAQAKHEPSVRALRFERIQTIAKLTRRAQWLMVHQDEVWRQRQRGVLQYLGAYLPEMLPGHFFLLLGLRALTGGQASG